jgi:hypothetical protein
LTTEEEDVVDADFDNPEEQEEAGEAEAEKEKPDKKVCLWKLRLSNTK